ncbi:hypothetical protein GOV13_02775 [Candidatus Pacearchaeota archaeon]|nr:hypothetical protein [Candidatus Pacearchaeota archaeon]
MHEIEEKKQIPLTKIGGSKAPIIPPTWIEKLEAEEDSTLLTLTLCKGKKGYFIELYKKKEE